MLLEEKNAIFLFLDWHLAHGYAAWQSGREKCVSRLQMSWVSNRSALVLVIQDKCPWLDNGLG